MSSRPEPGHVPCTLMLLGSGELGKELAVVAQGIGLRVVAVDRYAHAPAMQVADVAEVLSMLDGAALEGVIRTHDPDFVVPELEAIRTEKLEEMEASGFTVVPSARATGITMSREAMRRIAADDLEIRTPAYTFADSEDELRQACDELGYPCVVKPGMSSSGRGQSVVSGPARVDHAWAYAREGARGDVPRVIVEELVDFHTEITLLTVRERGGSIRFVEPIGHRQERGQLQEAWMPSGLPEAQVVEAKEMARRVVDRLGGAGVFGAEFFVTNDEVIFTEVSPHPHDTGLVTLIGQDLSQFELHLRAILGLPIPGIRYHGPAAVAVIPARGEGKVKAYEGVDRALRVETAQLRLFGKPTAHPHRRMGIALAGGETVDEARARALEAAARVEVVLE
jgi:phosphoribosylglycinamide formyltransferase 2